MINTKAYIVTFQPVIIYFFEKFMANVIKGANHLIN